jgi:hypothetical protein
MEASLREEKTHFGLWFEVKGQGLGKRRMWRPF